MVLYDLQTPEIECCSHNKKTSVRVRINRLCGLRFRLCVLGSGSGGNGAVIQYGDQVVLMDAGFGPRTTFKRMQSAGLESPVPSAICLTHLDQDHFRPSWVSIIEKYRIRLFLHRRHYDSLTGMRGMMPLINTGLVNLFDHRPFEPVSGLMGRSLLLQHDMKGTAGYRFDCSVGSMGYATDFGHVPNKLIELFTGVDLLCIESNYDSHMTMTSTRPTFVKRRNMSRCGHLSNEQAFEAVRSILDLSPAGLPRDIILMHRSSVCNHPMKIRRLFEHDQRLPGRITLAEQRRRTKWFEIRPVAAIRRSQMKLMF